MADQFSVEPPAYTVEPPAQKFTVQPPAAPAKPGAYVKGVDDAFGKLQSDYLSTSKQPPPPDVWGQVKQQFGRLVDTGKLPLDAFNAAMSLTGLPQAVGAGAKMYGEGVHALLPRIPASAPEADIKKALLALGPETEEVAPEALAVDGESAARAAQGADKIEQPSNVARETKDSFTVESPPKPVPGEPILEKAPPKENQDYRAMRWDDAANRLQTNDEASKMEAAKWVDELPPDLKKPEPWQNLYTQVEQRLVDPSLKLTPEAQDAYDAIKPWSDKQTELAKWIKAHGGTEEDVAGISDASKGYARRVVAGKGHPFDAFDPAANWEIDPIRSTPGGTSLSRYAPSVHESRKFFVLDDGKGERTFLKNTDGMKPGDTHTGTDGKTYTVRPATSQEVEANTPVRYHKNYAANTIDNVIRLERVKNNMEVLDKLLDETKERGEVYVGGRGKNAERPDGWIESRIPQFRDHYFPPEVAKDMNQVFAGQEIGGDAGEALAKVNRILNSSLYWQPFSHQLNLFNDFIVGRGWDWAKPGGYVSLLKNGTRAMKAFTTRNSDYVRYLRDGASLHYPGVANRNFYNTLYKKFGQTLERDPVTWEPLARSMGFGKGADAAAAVRDMVKAYYQGVSKVMWGTDDLLKMTRMFEYESRGMSAREAIAATEKEMANYRIAPRIAGGRVLTQLLKSPNVLRFGRYDANKVRILSGMFKDLVKGSRDEQSAAAGKFLAMGAMIAFIYPALDQVYKSAFGPTAQSGRHGITGLATGMGNVALKGAQGDWSDGWRDFIHQVFNLAGVNEIAGQVASGKDYFGRDIVQSGASPLGQATEFGEWIGNQFGPVQTAEQMLQPQGFQKAIMRNVGGKTDQNQARSGRVQKIIRGEARSRERKDAIEQALRKIGL